MRNKAYTPPPRKIRTDLQDSISAYLTNGKYDPRRSEMRAMEYKEKRDANLKARRKDIANSIKCYGLFQTVVNDIQIPEKAKNGRSKDRKEEPILL